MNRLESTAYRPNHMCVVSKRIYQGIRTLQKERAYFPFTIDSAWTDALSVIHLTFARQPGEFAMRCFRHWFETT